jgi:hypothetical protein
MKGTKWTAGAQQEASEYGQAPDSVGAFHKGIVRYGGCQVAVRTTELTHFLGGLLCSMIEH